MEGAGGAGQLRAGGAILLAAGVLLLAVADPAVLLLVPLGLLLVGIAPRSGRSTVLGASLLLLGALFAGTAAGRLTLGWAAVLAGAFLGLTLLRPGSSPFARGLAATAAAFVLVGVGLAAAGVWVQVDARMLEHFERVSAQTLAQMRATMPASRWTEQFASAGPQVARLQWTLFPAVLALQSLAALMLGWWLTTRARGAAAPVRPLGGVRSFRFADPMVWALVAGLVLIAVPAGDALDRVGWNALFFMASLYVLRGLAVLGFVLAGVPTAFLVALALFAVLFMYPIVLLTALLVGLGDTWLDVRARAATAART